MGTQRLKYVRRDMGQYVSSTCVCERERDGDRGGVNGDVSNLDFRDLWELTDHMCAIYTPPRTSQ